MRSINPAIIPRNHLVEEALTMAEEDDDLSAFQKLLTALQSPYELSTDLRHFREPPTDESCYRTFCGT